jgi:hypothetical protein
LTWIFEEPLLIRRYIMRIYKENKIKDLDYLEILKTIPDEIEIQNLAKVNDVDVTYDDEDKKQIDIVISNDLNEYTLICGFNIDVDSDEID